MLLNHKIILHVKFQKLIHNDLDAQRTWNLNQFLHQAIEDALKSYHNFTKS